MADADTRGLEEAAAEIIATNALSLKRNLKIIARSHFPQDDQRLKLKGITLTVEPEFEAAVSISKKLLNYFGKSNMDVVDYLRKSRRRERSKLKDQNGDKWKILTR